MGGNLFAAYFCSDMMKLRKLHIPLFVVLLSGFVALFNQAHQYVVFSANGQTTSAGSTAKHSSFYQDAHHNGSLKLLAELPDLEEESDSEQDRISVTFDQPVAYSFVPTITKLSRHLFDLPAHSWSEHDQSYQQFSARISLYKRVCVFRI